MTGHYPRFIRCRLSLVEVHGYHAAWWEWFDHERHISAANVMSKEGVTRFRLLRVDSNG